MKAVECLILMPLISILRKELGANKDVRREIPISCVVIDGNMA